MLHEYKMDDCKWFFFPVNFDLKEKYYEDPEAGYVINTFDVIISANLHAIYQVRHNGKVYFDEHQEEILQFWADYIIDILRRNKCLCTLKT